MTVQAGSGRGLFESLTALATTVVAILQTRLELLALDVEEEGHRWLITALLALGGLFLLGVGLVLVTLWLVVAFWDTHRLLVLGAAGGSFTLAGAASCLWFVQRLRTGRKPFANSLAELARDRQHLMAGQ